MKYRRSEAKEFARTHMKGIWAAALMPFNEDLSIDETGFRKNLRHWVDELAKHAQAIGAPYIVVHAPLLHFLGSRDETLYQYYKTISEQVDIGIAMWSHEDSGYLMSPELCARIAELPNIVAIKYSVPREMYVKLT